VPSPREFGGEPGPPVDKAAAATGKPANVTLRDVAKAAGVHYSTASRALSGDGALRVRAPTAERIQRAAEELGYRPHMGARGLRKGRTGIIGVVVADLGNSFIAPVIRGIENALEPRGLMAVIAETQDEPGRFAKALEHLASRRVDALITSSARVGDAETVTAFAGREAPVVLVVRNLPGSGLPCVHADDRRGGELAAGYLIELGHRVLSQLRGPQDMQPFLERAEGFAETVLERGVELVEIDESAASPTHEEGQRLMVHLLAGRTPKPSAIFAHNDPMAIGALDVLVRSGLSCPGDVSIMGFNDNDFTDHVNPPLSTIRTHAYEMGRRAGELTTRLLEDGEVAVPDVIIPPLLIPRASTRRHP
jgi:LacI family transcriptional regulator